MGGIATVGHCRSTKMMKIAIALAVCLSVAYVFAAEEKDEYGHDKDDDKDEYGHGGSDSLGALVHKEVAIIVSKNPAMTSAQCTQRCDDLFGMFDDGNEMSTDSHC